MALIGEMQYLTIGGSTYSIPTGTTVEVERNLTSGTKSATIKVDGTSYDLYAPTPNAGTVTSVRVQATSPVQSSTSTAQSSSLNTTISLANGYGDTKNPYGTKTKNYVLAGPTTGNDAAPTFRALVAADIPDLSGTYLTSYTETDPVYSASAASGITSSDISNWNSKTSNTGTITSVKTTAGAHTTINVSSGAANFNVPTATSHLTNDSGFITSFTDENVKSTAVTAATTYYLTGSTSSSTATGGMSKHAAIKAYVTANTSTGGSARIDLGNTTATTSAGGKEGIIRLYGTSATYYVELKAGAPSANRTISFPNKAGTVALTSDIPTVSYPVTSVNNKTGAVSLTASDVGALASSTTYVSTVTTTAGTHSTISSKSGTVSFNVPTKTSHLTNDSGFITSYTDEKVKTNAATASSNYYVLMGTNTNEAETKTYDTRIKYSYTDGTSSAPGIALLSLGNDSNVLPNSIKGRIKLYAQSGSVTIDPGTSQNSTVLTLPNTTGTLALTSDIPDTSGFILTETDPVFSSSAAAGITATDISNWNAKADSDVNVKNTTVTAATTYYLTGSTSSSTATGGLSKHAAIKAYVTANSGTGGSARIDLGNTTATTSAGGKEGIIRLYGTSATYYVDLKAGAPSANRTITLPNKTGTVALTDDIPTVPTITLNGTSTTTPSFYAPTTAGTNGYFLKSNGSGAPTWTAIDTTAAQIVRW